MHTGCVQWKKRFSEFENYAERLGVEARELKAKIDGERKESKRLSGMVMDRQQQNSELQTRE